MKVKISPKKDLDVVTADLVYYIKEMHNLAKPLDRDQREYLAGTFETILVLLISLKKTTNLGNFQSPFRSRELP